MSFRGLKVTRDCFEMRKTGKGTKSHGHDFFALFLKKKTFALEHKRTFFFCTLNLRLDRWRIGRGFRRGEMVFIINPMNYVFLKPNASVVFKLLTYENTKLSSHLSCAISYARSKISIQSKTNRKKKLADFESN
jgi:hypothetical protein